MLIFLIIIIIINQCTVANQIRKRQTKKKFKKLAPMSRFNSIWMCLHVQKNIQWNSLKVNTFKGNNCLWSSLFLQSYFVFIFFVMVKVNYLFWSWFVDFIQIQLFKGSTIQNNEYLKIPRRIKYIFIKSFAYAAQMSRMSRQKLSWTSPFDFFKPGIGSQLDKNAI